ncbi:MAG: carbon storage regulator [Tatlockia sp.]|nr:carbon storage regulator [Tatlockia sp.]
MDIVTINFEEKLVIDIRGQGVTLVAFQTLEPGNVKFGIDAPRSMRVNRQEVQDRTKDAKDSR